MKNDLLIQSTNVRKNIIKILHRSKASHVGSCFSIVDLLVVLYNRILNVNPINPQDPKRDIFLLSKGHAAVALYCVLAENNFVNQKILDTYGQDESILAGHVVKNSIPGIEATAGSLGHALSMAAGMSLAAQRADDDKRRFYCLMGDGECNEGSVWEAAMFASHFKLNNLIAIVDYNKQQGMGESCSVIDFGDMANRWRAFGWEVLEINGHDFEQVENAFIKLKTSKELTPKLLLANTIKGKGVSFMEDKVDWHYKSPNQEQLEVALKEIESSL